MIAAIYVDGWIEQARAFVIREFAGLIEEVRQSGLVGRDHKSALQERLQSRDHPLPEYRLVSTSGPDHQKMFRVEVCVLGRVIAEGHGSSKKEAEQEAARMAIMRLTDEGRDDDA